MKRDISEIVQNVIRDLVMANRILANEGILDALGHVSVRNPEQGDTFFQARSLSPYEVTAEDILEIDLQGNQLTKKLSVHTESDSSTGHSSRPALK